MEPRHWVTLTHEQRGGRKTQTLEYTDKTQGVIAEDEHGLMAAVILQSWTPNMCSLHAWIPRPIALRHGFIEEVFGYVFNTCGLGLVLAAVPANNRKAQRFNRHVGFEHTATITDGYKPGVDMQVWQMRREDCRWLGEQNELWQRYA